MVSFSGATKLEFRALEPLAAPMRLQMDERAKFVIEGGLYNDAVHSEPLGGIYADVDTCGEVYGPGRCGTGGGAIRLPRLKR